MARKDNGPRMVERRYAHVVGWGVDLPEKVMTNHDIEQLVETSDKWIRDRTGIAERRIAHERDTVVTMGVRAARRALQKAGMLPTEIDMIVVSTSSPTHFFPSTACLIQDKLGATSAGAFDVLAACTGFIYALGVGASHIKSGMADTVLVIGTETMSRLVDWSDRGTCILFGDGAGALILQASDVPGGVKEVVLHSDGSGADNLYVSTGIRGAWDGKASAQRMAMNGREVFRFASRVMGAVTEEVVEKAGYEMDDIDLIVPHQANMRIIQSAARGLKLPIERFYVNIDRYGNTSAASIPIAIAEAAEKGAISTNDRVVLVGFGAGLTWGSALIEWAVEPSPRSQIRAVLREGYYIVAAVRSFLRRVYRFLEAVIFRPPGQVYKGDKDK